MTGEAAIYLETRPAVDGRGAPTAALVFRSAAGGADVIGVQPAPGGDVRRRRLPVSPEAARTVWQRMKRDADQVVAAVGPRSPHAPAAAVASALAAAGLDPRALLAPATSAAVDSSASSPAAAPSVGADGAKVAAALTGAGPDPLETALLKGPDGITEDEVRHVMRARMDLPSGDPRQAALIDFERRYFDHAYGSDPAARDETGRLLPPVPRPDRPSAPHELATPSGEPLAAALDRAVAPVAQAAQRDGVAAAVRAAQAGLNRLRAPDAAGRRLLDVPLKEDGDPGPKTRAALTRAVARLGAAKVGEALALAQLRQVAAGGTSRPGLALVARDALAPLFHDSCAPAARAIEAEVLQETLNALGATPPLAVDGAIGPKTEAAFRDAAHHHGAEPLTAALGHALGFDAA